MALHQAVLRAPEPTLDELSHEWVGKQVRELRKVRGLTLKELSLKSGLSTGLLSQMERGISAPSIRSLQALGRALEVPASWFFHDRHAQPAHERDVIVRRGTGRQLSFDEDGFRKELVTPDLSGALEALIVTIDPGGSSGVEPYSHSGEEIGYVLEGEIELWVADNHYRLEAGDCFRFASTNMHRFANPGQKEARVLWVITPPFY